MVGWLLLLLCMTIIYPPIQLWRAWCGAATDDYDFHTNGRQKWLNHEIIARTIRDDFDDLIQRITTTTYLLTDYGDSHDDDDLVAVTFIIRLRGLIRWRWYGCCKDPSRSHPRCWWIYSLPIIYLQLYATSCETLYERWSFSTGGQSSSESFIGNSGIRRSFTRRIGWELHWWISCANIIANNIDGQWCYMYTTATGNHWSLEGQAPSAGGRRRSGNSEIVVRNR